MKHKLKVHQFMGHRNVFAAYEWKKILSSRWWCRMRIDKQRGWKLTGEILKITDTSDNAEKIKWIGRILRYWRSTFVRMFLCLLFSVCFVYYFLCSLLLCVLFIFTSPVICVFVALLAYLLFILTLISVFSVFLCKINQNVEYVAWWGLGRKP
jgi:hypothetical protein